MDPNSGSENPRLFLVYVSSATLLFPGEDLRALLATSRKNNAELGVTGMLLYKDGNFIQILEGDEEAVRRGSTPGSPPIPATAARSPSRRASAKGGSPDWSMGFRDLNSPEERSTPVYSELLNAPLTGRKFPCDPLPGTKAPAHA